jgi:hypothetical protein
MVASANFGGFSLVVTKANPGGAATPIPLREFAARADAAANAKARALGWII